MDRMIQIWMGAQLKMSSNPAHAVQARQFLDYCRHALTELRKDPTGPEWIVRWAGAIALLRVVGFALQKQDGPTNPALGRAQAAWWNRLKASKPDPAIFWDFIQEDRNVLLHGAEIRAGQSTMLFLVGVSRTRLVAGQANPPATPAPPLLKATHSYHMNSGSFARRDPRDLVQEAIEWWEQQITEIEIEASK